MGHLLSIAVLLASGAGRPVLPAKPRAASIQPFATTVTMIALPASISFTGSDPDSPTDAGNSQAIITWTLNGHGQKPWSMTIQSSAPSFANCSTVPASAVTVSCSSITVGGASEPCGSPVTLSTTPQVIASGTEVNTTAVYWVILTFTLTDQWRFVAQQNPQCSLSLTYNGNF